MKATVNFFGYFRDVVRDGNVQLTLPEGATVGDLIQTLVERYGDRVRQRLLREDGTLLSGVKLAVGSPR